MLSSPQGMILIGMHDITQLVDLVGDLVVKKGSGHYLVSTRHWAPVKPGGRTMKGNTGVLDALNAILTAELTAINQYFIHFRMCENWGFSQLAKKKREESIEEMKHADKVIARILFLDG